MPTKKITAKSLPILADTYRVMQDCVEKGVEFGWNRAHKHCENPSVQHIRDEIYDEIMLSISEYFVFPDVHKDE